MRGSANQNPLGDDIAGDKLVNGHKFVSHHHLGGYLLGETIGQRMVRMIIALVVFTIATVGLLIPGPKLFEEESKIGGTAVVMKIPGVAVETGADKLVEHVFLLPLKKDYWDIARASNHGQSFNIAGGCVMLIAGLYVLLIIQAEWQSPTPLPSRSTARKAVRLWWKNRNEYRRRVKQSVPHRKCAEIHRQVRMQILHQQRVELALKILNPELPTNA